MKNVENVAVIIPARFASSRFPGKPLAMIDGKTMIERVYSQAKKARSIKQVIVATDDARIFSAVQGFGGECIMTGTDHASGTDRLAEVAVKMPQLQVFVNVQGDEPMIDPGSIDAVVEPIIQNRAEMATISCRIHDEIELINPQLVKVVVDQAGNALYFSRHPIPFYRSPVDFGKRKYLGHLGLYSYSRECLLKLAGLAPTPLELAESLEQLRALEHGIKINVVEFETRSLAVDVPEDIAKVEKALQVSPV